MQDTSDDVFSIAINTNVANPFISSLGAFKMPVILDMNDEHRWLRPNASLSRILYLLQPYPVENMNAYPVSPIPLEASNSPVMVQPKGKPLFDESFQLDMGRS